MVLVMIEKLIEDLKKSYINITKIEPLNGSLVIYADDDTLWKILENLRDDYNMEYEADAQEENFIRIII